MGSGRDINPALLTRMSSFLKDLATVEAAATIESWSRTFRSRMMIDDIGDRLASFAAACRVVSMSLEKGSMELRAICDAPAQANEWAVARPMPPEAPVMRTA